MRYRQVGRSGLTVSVIGLGTRRFGREADAATVRRVVDAAIDAGVSLIDTAHSYGEGSSEEVLGAALEGKRNQVVLSTKFGSRRQRRPDVASGSRRAVREAVHAALRRLRTDYIDLYQLHFPDPLTPIEETLAALDELVHEGLVRYIGSSNFEAWQLVEADWASRAAGGERFVSAQREYHLLDRAIESDVLPVCERYGIGLIAWRALGDGALIGSGPADAPADLRVARVRAFAADHGLEPASVALGALLAQPIVAAVLTGARTEDHIRANVTAADWEPAPSQLAELRAVLDGGGRG
jgi:aryl-alcohol dehydrogenase-like predicted oxidoreductase